MIGLIAVLTPFSQVLAVLTGMLLIIGALFGYNKYDVDGFVAFIFSMIGVTIVLYGIGGVELLEAMHKF